MQYEWCNNCSNLYVHATQFGLLQHLAPTHGPPGIDAVKSLLLMTQTLLQDHELLAVAAT
jgi:hypothetical protein